MNPSVDPEAILKEQTEELLKLLGFKEFAVAVKGEGEGINVQVTTQEEAGILIGYHGETLTSMKLMLGLMLYQKTGQWLRLSLNINDYLERRRQQLVEKAQEIAVRVVEAGKSETLPYLSSYERLVIHEALAAHPQVVTESLGEGQARRLVVSPK